MLPSHVNYASSYGPFRSKPDIELDYKGPFPKFSKLWCLSQKLLFSFFVMVLIIFIIFSF